MRFQRLSEGVKGQSRSPQSRWKVVPQLRMGGREARIAKFIICLRHGQLLHAIGFRPQWATTDV